MTDFFNVCRDINQVLGALMSVGVIWRGLPLTVTRWRAPWPDIHAAMCFHMLAFFGVASAAGSIYYTQHTTADASPVAPLVVLANLITIGLCIFWPPSSGKRRRASEDS